MTFQLVTQCLNRATMCLIFTKLVYGNQAKITELPTDWRTFMMSLLNHLHVNNPRIIIPPFNGA